jgi:hypothetical protein
MALASGSITDVFDAEVIVNGETEVVVNGNPLNTMAQEIDKAFDTLRQGQGFPPLKGKDEAFDRRLLFVAIAKGVIAHLKNNQTSLTVSVSSSTHTGHVTVHGS